ncbi:hypothetical protein HGM15179_005964 [Zosterops borbonicus]|uniref:Uncharacterized protein n=1 Tax=Zosterops borbonicus TaxID=364589 RepID=A0A8K1GNE7_9PASS|nr:hypothetical protein HGM15179_005964 [Zosterops borbonicus]
MNNHFGVFGTTYLLQDKDVNKCSITALNCKVFGEGVGFCPSSGVGSCLPTAHAMSCWGVEANSSQELPVWIALGDEQGQAAIQADTLKDNITTVGIEGIKESNGEGGSERKKYQRENPHETQSPLY